MVGALGAVLPLLLAGCVQGQWNRVRYEEPIPAGALERFAIGSEATAVFAALGAPTAVWELAQGGAALVWAHDGEVRLGISASVTLDDSPVLPSLGFGDDRGRVRGVMVLLNRDFKVQEVRSGDLGSLAPPPRRPSPE